MPPSAAARTASRPISAPVGTRMRAPRRGRDNPCRDRVRRKPRCRGAIVACRSGGKRKPGNPRLEPARDRHADRAQSRKPDAQIGLHDFASSVIPGRERPVAMGSHPEQARERARDLCTRSVPCFSMAGHGFRARRSAAPRNDALRLLTANLAATTLESKITIEFQLHREDPMQTRRSVLKLATAGVAASPLLSLTSLVRAQEKPIRLGVLYDLSGPFAAAGSLPCAIGAQIAIDLANEHGGVLGKYKVEPVKADSQSKADVAINEAERLIDQENVDVILGVYSSAHAVPLAEKLDQAKKILWITTAVSSAVVKGKNRQFTFRTNIHS